MRFVTAIAAALVLAVCPATPATALQPVDPIERAAGALRGNPVYVDPAAERKLDARQAESLRDAIRGGRGGPIYAAVLPQSAADAAGGDATAALREVARAVGRPGTYVAVVGNQVRAGSTGTLPRGRAGELAREALDARGSAGTAAVLEDFVRRADAAEENSGSSSESGDGGGIPGWFLLALLGVPVCIFGFSRFRRRREERAELARLKDFTRDDLVALGEDIRALDLDVEMPGVDPEARRDYGHAVECYQQAETALDRARRPDEIEHVSSSLEEGRFAMTAAKARLEGRKPPERRPPCFFDPRHGPSTTDVEWAPAGGAPRPVPACAADAQRIQDGLDPDARQVPVAGGMTPYWNAGTTYMPWAGGFFGGFGGGLLPGLFLGSMLGSGFGFGGPIVTEDANAMGDFGDFGGGGDFGDFGGGGDF